MPHSGIAFVSARPRQQDAAHVLNHYSQLREQLMCIEKFARNLAFALAAGVVIFGVGFTFEYLPLVNALAR
jgi:hypothetical protein